MNFKFRNIFLPLVVGAVVVSCEHKEQDVVMPEGSLTAEAYAALSSANLIFEETFEGSNPFSTAHSKELGPDHALSYVSNPVFQGSKAARFEVRKDDPLVKDGKRAEVTVVSYKQDNKVQKDMWYSFAAYFPSNDYKIDNQSAEVISQWKHSSSDGGGSPATALRVQSDRFFLDTGYNDKEGVTEVIKENHIDLGAVTKDVWHEFVFHIIHTHEADGLIEVWHNGKKILTHKGGNYYNIEFLPKWKIGLYKSGFKYDKSDVDKRVIYFDNVRVGQKNASFTDMTSGTASAAPAPAPAPSEPVTTEPVKTAPSEPVTTEPVKTAPSEPVTTEPVETAPTEPVTTEPVKTEPTKPSKDKNKRSRPEKPAKPRELPKGMSLSAFGIKK